MRSWLVAARDDPVVAPEPNTVHGHDFIPGSLLTLYDHVIWNGYATTSAHQPVPDGAAKPRQLPLRVTARGRCMADRLTDKPALTRRAVLPPFDLGRLGGEQLGAC